MRISPIRASKAIRRALKTVLTSGLLGLAMAASSCQSTRHPQTAIVLIESGPVNLDPRIGTDAQSARIGELIFDSLLRRDEQSQLVPALALAWQNPDPLTYILKLRTGVKFHNGRPLRSRDVQYTLETLISGVLKSAKAGSFARIKAVEAPDDSTLIIHLKEPYASFLWNLTQGAFGVIPEGMGDDMASHPIGSGPFRFVEASQDEFVRLERNTNYWGGPPKLVQVEFKVVPDATTRALELRNGSADVVVNALPADTVASLSREPRLTVSRSPGNTYQYLGLNLRSPKLSLPVRQAIAYGIDREAIIEHLWHGLVRPADSVLPVQHWAHGAGLPEYQYSPTKAVSLLKQAGFGAGSPLTLTMKTSTDQGGRELAAILQDQLSKIGIHLDVHSYEFATFYSDISKGNFELFSLRWIGGNEDPDIFEYAFHSDKTPPKGANRGQFRDPKVDELIELAGKSTVLEARQDYYQKLQSLLNEQLPYIHLWYLDTIVVHNRRLADIHGQPNGSYYFLTRARSERD